MIRRLRRRHFRLVLILALFLPAIIALALSARQHRPLQEIPPALRH